MAVCTYPHRSRASPATLIHFSLVVLAVSLLPLPLAGQYLVVSPSDPESASDVELVRNLRVQLQGLGMEVVGGGPISSRRPSTASSSSPAPSPSARDDSTRLSPPALSEGQPKGT